MQKWQQQFSIGYFVIALVLLFALQTFFASPHVATITYSRFKALAKKGLLSNVVIGEKIIRGEIKPERLKEVLPAERLQILNEQNKNIFAAQSFSMFIFSSLPFPDLDSNFLRIRVIEPQIRIISFVS